MHGLDAVTGAVPQGCAIQALEGVGWEGRGSIARGTHHIDSVWGADTAVLKDGLVRATYRSNMIWKLNTFIIYS